MFTIDYKKISDDNIGQIEKISEQIHHVYCQYYQDILGKEYWTKGDYKLLADQTKEADRYIARFIIANFEQKTA